MKITDVTLTLFAWDNIPPTTYGSHSGQFAGASALGIATVSPFCSWSTLSPLIWGNQNGQGQAVGPEASACAAWRAAHLAASNCAFRGEVTASQLVDRIMQILPIP